MPALFHRPELAQEVSPPDPRDPTHQVLGSPSDIRRLQADGLSRQGSWIDVSSQPSSSSLSSTTNEGIRPIVAGVQLDQHGRRRRRLSRNSPLPPAAAEMDRGSDATEASSQEEYEESESESDRIMTNSNEHAGAPDGIVLSHAPSATTSDLVSHDSQPATIAGEDVDTAVAAFDDHATVDTTFTAFTPPPNAFSHPNYAYTSTTTARHVETRTSSFSTQRRQQYVSPNRRPTYRTLSYPSHGSRSGQHPHTLSPPTQQADHDAALRASLSTLLSCAAAARGLSKREDPIPDQQRQQQHPQASPRSGHLLPSTMRLVPESALPCTTTTTDIDQNTHKDTIRPPLPPRPHCDSARYRASPSSITSDSASKPKRKASTAPAPSHPRIGKSASQPKRPRRATSPGGWADDVQPTLMTWVVSAGVVVLFSAISFSAGYAIGREVGRMEAGSVGGALEDGVVCGREVGRGLRRGLGRWSAGSGLVGGMSVVRV